MEKTFNFYLKARAFKYMKRVIVAVMVLLSLDMPADIAGPMIAASLLGGQVLTAQTKAKECDCTYICFSCVISTG